MINFIVAYDNQDVNLGTYFEDCKNQLLDVAQGSGLINGTVREILTNHCNDVAFGMIMPTYRPNPFVFVAYSHGNEKALCCQNNNYIEKDVNAHYFENSLFYTTACSVGKELGLHLIDKGCLAFVGYKSEIYVYKQDEKKQISRNCDNAGIIAFLSENITILEAYTKMKNYYTQEIDRLTNLKDMLFAGELVVARDSLIYFGNGNLKKEDLFIH
jgi:hypothetical protein